MITLVAEVTTSTGEEPSASQHGVVVVVGVEPGSSTRSGHGYAFHFLAMRQRGIAPVAEGRT